MGRFLVSAAYRLSGYMVYIRLYCMFQQLLLDDLYQTRMCHNLLVDAADEDQLWKFDTGPRVNKARMNLSSEFLVYTEILSCS